MQQQRRHFKQTQSLKQRLLDRVAIWRDEAKLMRPGLEREALLQKARQAETAVNIDEWLRSPGPTASEIRLPLCSTIGSLSSAMTAMFWTATSFGVRPRKKQRNARGSC